MTRPTKAPVFNRGEAPDSFLAELVAWGKTAPIEIFAPNPSTRDIYAATWDHLGPRGDELQWRAWMLEVMRVHAGMEASWNWNEGVDRSNMSSTHDKRREESGIFQVSFDSLRLDTSGVLSGCLRKYFGGDPAPQMFIDAMKANHALAMEYYARLVRQSITWAGPLVRHGNDSIYPWLSRCAMYEFETLLV